MYVQKSAFYDKIAQNHTKKHTLNGVLEHVILFKVA